ncbi:MAG: 5'-methylthioadenosine/S-adenosylhomocysteine nucleosidase, partial [Oscillospiraceae bacterium]
MRYGIICAVDEEINLIKKDIVGEKTTTIAKRDFIEGKLYGKDVVLVMSRVGKVASASTATTLIDRYHVDNIIFCGTAGGVDKSLNVGDVVVADNLVQHDVFDGVQFFKIPRLGVADFTPDKTLSEAMHRGIDSYIKNELKSDIPQQYLEEFKIVDPKVAVGT